MQTHRDSVILEKLAYPISLGFA